MSGSKPGQAVTRRDEQNALDADAAYHAKRNTKIASACPIIVIISMKIESMGRVLWNVLYFWGAEKLADEARRLVDEARGIRESNITQKWGWIMNPSADSAKKGIKFLKPFLKMRYLLSLLNEIFQARKQKTFFFFVFCYDIPPFSYRLQI